MKKWIGLAAVVAAVSTLAAAQGPNEEMMKAQQAQMLQRIQTELGLSDAQTKQWGEIQERYMKAHMKLRAEQNEEINKMLNKEQQQKFEQM